MKKSISIFLVFIFMICFSAFSQDTMSNFKSDFEWKGIQELPWYHGIPRLNQKDSVVFLNPDLEKRLNFPELEGQKFSFKTEMDNPAEGKLSADFKMPVYRPEGEFPILVYVPDENINYTIRIKEY